MTRGFQPFLATDHGTHAFEVGTIPFVDDQRARWSDQDGGRITSKESTRMSVENHRRWRCGEASPAAAVMLHLRACYVSKAAILTVPVQVVPTEIEVPLEFQGLGSLGAALWRRFFPCEFDSYKERASGCRRSVRFGSVRPLCNGVVRVGAR